MHRFARMAAAVLAASALLSMGGAALAQEDDSKGQALTIGASWLFLIRNGDTLNGKEWSVKDRIDHVQDVYSKYLGGQSGKITWKKIGDRVHLYLNGEFVLAVTPTDAKSCGYKSAEALAPIWLRGLEKGFKETHTPVSGSARN